MERRTSSASSFEAVIYDEKPSAISHRCSIKRKPLPKLTSMPGEYPEGRRLTPLLPMAKRPTSRGWGEEWTHLVRDTSLRGKGISNSDSAISLSSDSSGYMSSYGSSSDLSVSKRQGRPRTVTPSSSISNLSRRSPLSTMRYGILKDRITNMLTFHRSAEFPDVVIRPELRFLPPVIPPPHEWNLSRTASLSQLLPVADVHCLQRRPSVTVPPELLIRKPRKELPPLSKKQAPIIRKQTLDVKIPGAYIEYGRSLDHELKLEAHARKIEVESIARSESKREPKTPVRTPVGDFEKRYAPNPVDSRSRYRGKTPFALRSQIAASSKNSRPDSTQLMEAVQVEYVKVKPLRRLSLGEISPGLGKLWEI